MHPLFLRDYVLEQIKVLRPLREGEEIKEGDIVYWGKGEWEVITVKHPGASLIGERTGRISVWRLEEPI